MAKITPQNPAHSDYTARPRPLSPHLQVYKPQFTSVLSISARGAMIALWIGMLGFAAILIDYSFIDNCMVGNWLRTSDAGRILTKLVLCIYAVAASYWICSTIRHMFWDFGRGFHITTAYRTGMLSVFMTLLLSILIIYFGIL